ncbi:hypothetical protein D6D21_04880 [Aureobasidium pullulans]|uniref:Uncharacterized protein n=1 Tax=Aureobasidium pullulans TaxID=5580 RepID=A0AB74IXM5_AURPU|nr:hypothetical protein D6D21_04880 [Aureobasidium pullulans]
MAQQIAEIRHALSILIKSGHIVARQISDETNDIDLQIRFSGLETGSFSALKSLCDQSPSISSTSEEFVQSGDARDQDHNASITNMIENETSEFINPWNTKTGNEPWWPTIRKAMQDPTMLGKHPTIPDVELLKTYYSSSSARERAKDVSDAFTTKGNFKGRGQYDYLRAFVQKHPALSMSAGGDFQANKKHRVHCTWNLINSIPVYTGFVKVSKHPQHVVVGFTRASSYPPTYGRNGMFIRGKEAVKAWANMMHIQDCILVSLPRQQTSSRLSIYINLDDRVVLNPETNLSELEGIMDAANEEQVIDLLSIGFDALTTDLPSLDAFAERYRHLKINLVFAVPDQFPRLDLFPHETNGVRYGQVRLSELYAHRKHNLPSEMAACVEELLEAVTLRKEHVAHAVNLQELTRGRANFRISPDTETDSGVPAVQENKKEGWANPGAPRANRRKHRKQPDLKRRRVVEDEEEHVEV